MTFKEKLKQDYPMLEVENATQNSCPCDYEYEEKPSRPECEISKCTECWDREMPTDKTEESLKILEAHKKAYEQGLNDAWELAKKCVDLEGRGEDNELMFEIFNTVFLKQLFNDNTPQEALAKLKAYEESQEIKVGDVVKYDGRYGLITKIDGEYVEGIKVNTGTFRWIKSLAKKTDRHLDITSILEQIGGE